MTCPTSRTTFPRTLSRFRIQCCHCSRNWLSTGSYQLLFSAFPEHFPKETRKLVDVTHSASASPSASSSCCPPAQSSFPLSHHPTRLHRFSPPHYLSCPSRHLAPCLDCEIWTEVRMWICWCCGNDYVLLSGSVNAEDQFEGDEVCFQCGSRFLSGPENIMEWRERLKRPTELEGWWGAMGKDFRVRDYLSFMHFQMM